ncbi:hypothetical protein EUU23_01250 [Sphingorhabdus sp. IMCC26285]|uniref:Uncharacterized protein n=1 Tax=Sphingorhabdus profundilacus TaxID=2509718 RepID=A0A6I4LW76_9SPHN|nr:hypothetical protein [Sphingorhabdus profundilacus]MVZ96326.1 hypothetical protein [Sphingorhabdus profundilacus]
MMIDDDGVFWTAIEAPHGVAMISQSCDIIRDLEVRPYVQVAGLVPATDAEVARAIRQETPSRIYLESLDGKSLLIDLDLTATVHKTVVATWQRTSGCNSDGETRKLAKGLARHRQRFAFPDDFNDLIAPIRKWIESKRSKQSPHGNFVRALHEVRAHCDNWETPTELTFLAIVNDIPEPEELAHWEEAAKTLETKAQHDDYPAAEFKIVTYDSISAREYRESDRLDWDGLSDSP